MSNLLWRDCAGLFLNEYYYCKSHAVFMMIRTCSLIQIPITVFEILANLGSSFHGKPWHLAQRSLVSDLPAKPSKAQSMTGPCRALLEEIIPWSKAQQGRVNDRALQGIASSETFIARLLLPEEMIALKRLLA